MAIEDLIPQFRRMVDEPDDTTYSDESIVADFLSPNTLLGVTDLNTAAAQLWREKAAAAAELVNTSESGSSRALGDIYKNALEMAKHYEALATASLLADQAASTGGWSTTRQAVRG